MTKLVEGNENTGLSGRFGKQKPLKLIYVMIAIAVVVTLLVVLF